MRPFEMVIVKPNPMPTKIKQLVNQRRGECKCIACGEFPPAKREVCLRCYGRFHMNRPPKSLPIKRAKYDAAMETAGKIGVNCQGQRVDLDDYREIVRKVEAS